MAVETDTERAIFFDADDFGVAATFTPSGGSASTVNGIFDKDYIAVDAGGSVPVALEEPKFICKTSDVSTAAEGDSLVIDAVNYTVKVVESDGQGVTTLIIEEV